LFPNATPANGIFVAFDVKSDFEFSIGKLENFIYPALLGIDTTDDLKKKIDKILFVDTQTGAELTTIIP